MSDRQRFHLHTREDRARAVECVRMAGRGYVVDVRAPTRSLEQNDRMWAMLDEVSKQVDWYGEKPTSTEWKCIFTAALKRQKVFRGIDGGAVVVGQSTSAMTAPEMSDLIELMYAFGALHSVKFNHPEDKFAPVNQPGVDAGASDAGQCGADAPAIDKGRAL